jgi:hypothetical protein
MLASTVQFSSYGRTRKPQHAYPEDPPSTHRHQAGNHPRHPRNGSHQIHDPLSIKTPDRKRPTNHQTRRHPSTQRRPRPRTGTRRTPSLRPIASGPNSVLTNHPTPTADVPPPRPQGHAPKDTPRRTRSPTNQTPKDPATNDPDAYLPTAHDRTALLVNVPPMSNHQTHERCLRRSP